MTNTRPTMLMETGKLNAAKALGDEQHAACQRSALVPIETFTRSGYVANFAYFGHEYSLGTLCSCTGITITLSADGTPREYLNATYTCDQHGTHTAAAIRCAETPHSKPSAVFARSEQRHARDRRVAWGMKQ